MKKILIITIALVGSLSLFAQKNKKNTEQEIKLVTSEDSISYIIGTDVGGSFHRNGIAINLDAFVAGMKDVMKGNDSVISNEVKMAIMQKFQQEMQNKQQAKMSQEAEGNKATGKAFLEENKKKEGVKVTPSGLQYKVIQEGTGNKPAETSKVTVNYEGKLISGKVFDSSYERGQPATFPLNGVIKGWTEGLQLMSEGAIYEFYIPSELAYGDRSNQAIPGGSTLIFKVELIKVEAEQ